MTNYDGTPTVYDDPGGGESRFTGGPSRDSDDSKKKSRKSSNMRDSILSAGRDMNEQSVQRMKDIAADRAAAADTRQDDTPRYQNVPSFKRGGVKRKSGPAYLHRGETAMRTKKKARKRGRM